MRRLIAILTLLALAASACQIRTDIELDIAADESGTIAFELGFDEEFRQLAASEGGEFSADNLEGFGGDVPDDWTVEDFVDGEFAGTRFAVGFESLADLESKLRQIDSASDDPTADFFDTITVTRDGETFRFEATVAQLDDAVSDNAGFDFGIDPAQFLSEVFLVRFVVTMPGAVTSHNADRIDGSTLVWEVPLDGSNRTLTAVSGSSGEFPLLLLLVAIGGIGLLAALWVTVQRRRRQVDVVMYGHAAGHIVSEGEAQPIGADPFAG